MYFEQFDFEVKLKDGTKVYVEVECEIEDACDCYCADNTHPHIIDHEYITIMDTKTELEVALTDELAQEIDSIVDVKIYRELEVREEESLYEPV